MHTETYAALGHQYIATTVAPTCTEQGYTVYTCKCKDTYKADYTEAHGHSFGAWTLVTPPSEVAEGLERRDCNNCSHYEEKSIPKLESTPTGFAPLSGNAIQGYKYLGTLPNAENMQALYREIDSICRSFNNRFENVTSDDLVIGEVDYSKYSLTREQALEVYRVFSLDTPRYYWLGDRYQYTSKMLGFTVSSEYADGMTRKLIYPEIERFLNKMSVIANEYPTISQKALAIHDEIIALIDYQYEADGVTPLDTVWTHNILGVVQGLGGVCEAYAETYQMVLSSLGVECITVLGDAPTPHAWNLVRFEDGKWYDIDVTWDDLGDGKKTYVYFGADHDTFSTTHTAYTNGTDGMKYMFITPMPQNNVSLSPVELYKGTSNIGRFVSLSAAFSAMTDPSADYTLILSDLIAPYNLYDNIPAVGSLAFKGSIVVNNGGFSITRLLLNSNISVATDVIFENIALEAVSAADIDMRDNTLYLVGSQSVLKDSVTIKGSSNGTLVMNVNSQPQISANLEIGNVQLFDGVQAILLDGNHKIVKLTLAQGAYLIVYDNSPVKLDVGTVFYSQNAGYIQIRCHAEHNVNIGTISGDASYALFVLSMDSMNDMPTINFANDCEIPLYFTLMPSSSSIDIKAYDGIIFTAPNLSPEKLYFFKLEGGSFVNDSNLLVFKDGVCRTK